MLNIDDPDRFQKIASGIQSWLLSAALLVGGGWTIYLLKAQVQVENAQAQLVKLNRDLQESPKLEIELTVKQLNRRGTSKFIYLECELNIKNVGNKSTIFSLAERGIELYKVKVNESGTTSWQLARRVYVPTRTLSDGKQAFIGPVIVHALSSNRATWVLALEQTGLYVVSIESPRALADESVSQTPGAPAFWSAERYVLVK